MVEFVSEPIKPEGGAFERAPLAAGEPGLPPGFRWRGESLGITAVVAKWRMCSREGARAQGDLYLRRHCFQLLMSDRSRWTVYCVRQAPRRGRIAPRWYLQTREIDGPAPEGGLRGAAP